jgi:probable F420-dependent oxidoreductase
MPRRCKVGVQLHPQQTTITELRAAWERADALGVDSIWAWDHFYPLYGEADGPHFEGMSLLAAMAVTTSHASLGLMVTCNSYRNPELLADMIRTIDQLSGGRAVLGIGSGWFERDYAEYGFEFGTAVGRLHHLGAALPRIVSRLGKLNPGPVRGHLPILVGGSGEKVTLRLVAEYADAWNTFGPPESYGPKNRILDNWCAELGRDPRAIERTVCIGDDDLDRLEEYLDVGADHIILMSGHPFPTDGLERLVAFAEV